MGEARRRRLAGEPPRPEADLLRSVAPEDVRDMPGRVRVTLLDDDDEGCTGWIEAGRLAELMTEIGILRFGGRRADRIASDPAGWARLRAMAFDRARTKLESENWAAAALGLWCALNGPQGPEMRHRLADVIGRAGRAAVLLRRHRGTGTVATFVAETLDGRDLDAAARMARASLPDGMVAISLLDDDEPRVEH